MPTLALVGRSPTRRVIDHAAFLSACRQTAEEESMLTAMTMRAPFGALRLYAEHDELVELTLPDRPGPAAPEGRSEVLVRTADQLAEYFAGTRRVFDLPLAPRGTAFQVMVWRALVKIPFAETRSYGEIARAVGRPAASRAVGAANGRNPIAIIVPCHRVIGSNGDLTGYGGGLPIKRWLLDHECPTGQLALAGPPAKAARVRAGD
jgi:methylated-DNA-[protein]-cysteine S-methyltransferase